MFRIRFAIILSVLAVVVSSCLQQKIDRANQAAANVPPVCEQYSPNGSRPNTVDFEQCKKDSSSYLFREEMESAMIKETVVAEEARTQEIDAGMMQVMPPTATSLPPTKCQTVASGDTVYSIVVSLIDYWPWDGEGLLTGTMISVESDFNGDGIREGQVFREEMGMGALPASIFPGDEICVAVR